MRKRLFKLTAAIAVTCGALMGRPSSGYTLLIIWCSLALGNYTYQWMCGQHWDKAFERTYFQAAALLTVLGLEKLEAAGCNDRGEPRGTVAHNNPKPL